jgi:hypothetical protein
MSGKIRVVIVPRTEEMRVKRKGLPERIGHRPRTTPTNPHTQLDQNPEDLVVQELARRVFALPDVEERPSAISVPGARALWLRDEVSPGPQEAFMIGRELGGLLQRRLLAQPASPERVCCQVGLPHGGAETSSGSKSFGSALASETCSVLRFRNDTGKHFWINVLLTILGYIPGIVHAVWVIAKY